MPRVSQRHKDEQRAEILDAARRCFVRNGFHRTSMQDVFAEAGKSAGAVYRYFPSKDGMIAAIAAQNLADVTAALHAALQLSGGQPDLGRVLTALLDEVARRHADSQLATMALMVWSEALRDPGLAAQLRAASAAMTRDIASLVRERQAAGALTGAPAESVAQVVLSVLPGYLFNLALLDPHLDQHSATSFPDGIRALWPGGVT
jgi:AcrR family transcriptional regulator